MEATESPEVVLQYYEELLKEDATIIVSTIRIAFHNADPSQAVWKRRISILRRTGQYEKAVEQLSGFLDTFYTDLEGWLELADIYSSCNQLSILLPIYCQTLIRGCRYTHALEALSHALLLAPQNPFTFLQFAETAYTAGDLPLALKMFLVVVEMGERDYSMDEPPVGINIRAWMGIKVVRRLLIRIFVSALISAAVHEATHFLPKSGVCFPYPNS